MAKIVIVGKVEGKPKTQGSVSPIAYKKKNGRLGVNVFQSKDLLHWRELIVADVKGRTNEKTIFPKGTPVTVCLSFYFLKPKSSKTQFPVTRSSGDIDKLTRAALDAFTESGVFDDDSQVVKVVAEKYYTDNEELVGMRYGIIEY